MGGGLATLDDGRARAGAGAGAADPGGAPMPGADGGAAAGVERWLGARALFTRFSKRALFASSAELTHPRYFSFPIGGYRDVHVWLATLGEFSSPNCSVPRF